MPNFKRQTLLFSLASVIYGIGFLGSLYLHEAPIHLGVRLVGCLGFGLSAFLAYRKHRAAGSAA